MMKKVLSIIALAIVAMLFLCFIGCSNNSSKTTGNPVSNTQVKSTQNNDVTEPQATKLRPFETYSCDDYDLTITGGGWVDEWYPDVDSTKGAYSYFADEEGHSYFVIRFEFHNKMKSYYKFDNAVKTSSQSVKFNKEYEYTSKIYDQEEQGLFVSGVTHSIQPFDTKTFMMVFDVNDEIRNMNPTIDLTWKFKKIITDGDNFTVTDELLGNFIGPFKIGE